MHSEPHEFADLNALWQFVEPMKSNESLDVRIRNCDVTEVFQELENDKRFKLFTWRRAQHQGRRPIYDPFLFTIKRTSNRKRGRDNAA